MPLLELRALRREYVSGGQTVVALRDVDLSIEAGEMLAVVGSSGSGKSTLLNILGCLDRPSAGAYRVAGQDVAALDPDALAALRCRTFGFIFQRYQLLPRLPARANVELPAVYLGSDRRQRRNRAVELLSRFGLGERMECRPHELSGGQQQRVSIARALMNGAQVILADEPTGALDRATGAQIMDALRDLNEAGHTIIIVTHDRQIAERVDRTIELSDGVIVKDSRKPGAAYPVSAPLREEIPNSALRAWPHEQIRAPRFAGLARLEEACRSALGSMKAHRLRAFLTMLGIVIGISAVVCVVALGEGSRQYVLKQISSLGIKKLDINPGADMGDVWADRVHTLIPADAEALAGAGYVDSVSPSVSTSVQIRYRGIQIQTQVFGVGRQYFRVHGMRVLAGVTFDSSSIQQIAQEAVIDTSTQKMIFPDGGNPIGEIILIDSVPCRIIGVAESNMNVGGANFLYVWIPYTTAMIRLIGQSYLQGMTIRVADSAPMAVSKEAIVRTLSLRHGRKDFFIVDSDMIRKKIEASSSALRMLVSLIAAISLVIGGIGIMNITLVSVSERTQEIGVRMAVGARRSDIRAQFLIEAILICVLGGVIGVFLAFGIGFIIGPFVPFGLVFSAYSVLVALLSSTLTGLLFGFMPASHAAGLEPIVALARD